MVCLLNVARSNEECEIMEDGSQVCEPPVMDNAPTPLSGVGVGFAAHASWADKPIEELKKDPQWLETARRNNVIIDPEEQAKYAAMFEEEDQELDLGGGAVSEPTTNKLEFELIERSEERKALDRYEDGGNIVYSSLECYDVSESCSILLERNPNACGDIRAAAETPAEIKMRFKCEASCHMCEPTEENAPQNVPHTSIGEPQTNDGDLEERNKVNAVISAMIPYLRDVVLVEQGYSEMYNECRNAHELCAFWASMGECDKNPVYMHQNCNLACMTCNQHPLYQPSPVI